jgi:L-lactate dehydrogenase complex protein LldG
MFEAFKTRAEAVSAQVRRFAGTEQALSFVLGVLKEEGVSSAPGSHAVWAPCGCLERLDRAALSAERGVRFDVTRELAAAARVGVSQVDWGIADTGTVVQDATAVEQRLVSTLPMAHVAILPTRRIVPDLATLLKQASPRESAFLAFITGPSRTADIERVLTIGVHGPERLHVVCVDEL